MELLSYLRSKSSILNWMFYNRTENSRILILCSAYHYAVGWLFVVFCVKMGATGSVVVNLTGFFHSSCLNDASSGENLQNKTEFCNVKTVRILWSNFISAISVIMTLKVATIITWNVRELKIKLQILELLIWFIMHASFSYLNNLFL